MPSITPCLGLDNILEQAAAFAASVARPSTLRRSARMGHRVRYTVR
jgi:hypothetical protein